MFPVILQLDEGRSQREGRKEGRKESRLTDCQGSAGFRGSQSEVEGLGERERGRKEKEGRMYVCVLIEGNTWRVVTRRECDHHLAC